MAFLPSWQRLISRNGRPMTLRRQTSSTPVAFVDAAVTGAFAAYAPQHLQGGVQQGDGQVTVLQDPLAATGWPGPPRKRDAIVIDGRTWQVLDSEAVYDGTALIGHRMWVRGG